MQVYFMGKIELFAIITPLMATGKNYDSCIALTHQLAMKCDGLKNRSLISFVMNYFRI